MLFSTLSEQKVCLYLPEGSIILDLTTTMDPDSPSDQLTPSIEKKMDILSYSSFTEDQNGHVQEAELPSVNAISDVVRK
jgi:hypothetical protein